jgi:hypothetical protein
MGGTLTAKAWKDSHEGTKGTKIHEEKKEKGRENGI